MRTWMARPLVMAVAVLSLGACGRGIFRQPVVTLENVQVAGIGLRGGTLLVNLQVQNPNGFDLNADELEYQLAIADTEVAGDTSWIDLASGTYEEPFSVSAGQTSTVQIPVEFTYAGLGGAASSILRAGTFSYRASGSVDVRTPLGTYDVPFRRGGLVTLMGTR